MCAGMRRHAKFLRTCPTGEKMRKSQRGVLPVAQSMLRAHAHVVELGLEAACNMIVRTSLASPWLVSMPALQLCSMS